jgi:phosphopantetheinyl transferase
VKQAAFDPAPSYTPPLPVQVWMADPRCFQESHVGDLLQLLDASERERLARFRHEADARAYLLVHAMRRAAVAKALGASPGEIVFSHDRNGKPLLEGPRGREIFFSHSRRREGVACVITRAAAVGIDVESAREARDDEGSGFALLAPYMVLPDAPHRAADMGSDPDRQFRCYWTALEAYWKAQGTGLGSSNPRALCTKNSAGEFEVGIFGDPLSPRAHIFFLPSPNELTVAVALQLSDEANKSERHSFWVQVHHCNSSMEIYSSSMS